MTANGFLICAVFISVCLLKSVDCACHLLPTTTQAPTTTAGPGVEKVVPPVGNETTIEAGARAKRLVLMPHVYDIPFDYEVEEEEELPKCENHYHIGLRCYGDYERVHFASEELASKCEQKCKQDLKCRHYTFLDKHSTCYLYTKYASCEKTHGVWRSGHIYGSDRIDACEITHVEITGDLMLEEDGSEVIGVSRVASCSGGLHQLGLTKTRVVSQAVTLSQERLVEEPFARSVAVMGASFSEESELDDSAFLNGDYKFPAENQASNETRSLEKQALKRAADPELEHFKIEIETPEAAILVASVNRYKITDQLVDALYHAQCAGTTDYKRRAKVRLNIHTYGSLSHVFRRAERAKYRTSDPGEENSCVQRAQCVREIKTVGYDASTIVDFFKAC